MVSLDAAVNEDPQPVQPPSLDPQPKSRVSAVSAAHDDIKQIIAAHNPGSTPTEEQVAEALALLKKAYDAKYSDDTTIDYTVFPKKMQDIIKEFYDQDNSGTISAAELMAAAKSRQQLLQRQAFLKRVIFGGLVVICLLIGAMFGVSVLAIETTKEMRAANGGTMKTPEGDVVKVGSDDYEMKDDGQLAVRGTSRRLEECEAGESNNCSSGSIQVARLKLPLQLRSSLDDSVFKDLDEITLTSDLGAKVHMAVNGYIRVPEVGAKCGNVVYLVTVKGTIMLDDTDISFADDGSWDELNGIGFQLAVGGIGRRLTQGQATGPTGFFNKIDSMRESWECSSVPLPIAPKLFQATIKNYKVCPVGEDTDESMGGNSRISRCSSRYGGLMPGAITLPDALVRAVSSVTDREKVALGMEEAAASSDEEEGAQYYMRTIETMIDGTDYSVQSSRLPNHPTQHQATVHDKQNGVEYNFQVLHQNGSRLYCWNHTEHGRLRRRLQEAGLDSDPESNLHVEYIGLWKEADVMYRHWRLLPKDAALKAFGDDFNASGEVDLKQVQWEYWDIPGSLEPFRITTPDGYITEYHDFHSAEDTDVKQHLSHLGLSLEDAVAGGCFTEETKRIGGIPIITDPFSDLQPEDAAFYEQNLEHVEPNTSGFELSVWDDMTDYLTRVSNPLAVPDACIVPCRIPQEIVDRVSDTDEDICNTTAPYLKCLENGTRFLECADSNMVKSGKLCSMVSTTTMIGSSRILQDDADDSGIMRDSQGDTWGIIKDSGNSSDVPERLLYDSSLKCTPHIPIYLGSLNVDLCFAPRDSSNNVKYIFQCRGDGMFWAGVFPIYANGWLQIENNGNAYGEVHVRGEAYYVVINVWIHIWLKGGYMYQCDKCWGYGSCWESSCERRRRRGSWSWRRRSQGCYKTCWTSHDCNCRGEHGLILGGEGGFNFLNLVRGRITAEYRLHTKQTDATFYLDYRYWPTWPDHWRNGLTKKFL